MEKDRYVLVNYFDVWGNQEDGYEINNLCREGEIEVEDYTNPQQLLNALIEFGYFSEKATVDSVTIWNDYEMIEFYDAKTDMPLCRLELVRGE